MADMKKGQELISKSAKEELNIRQKNEESLKQQKEDLREMARLGQQMTATQKKAYDALVKADKKEEEIKKKKEKQLELEKKRLIIKKKEKLIMKIYELLSKILTDNEWGIFFKGEPIEGYPTQDGMKMYKVNEVASDRLYDAIKREITQTENQCQEAESSSEEGQTESKL